MWETKRVNKCSWCCWWDQRACFYKKLQQRREDFWTFGDKQMLRKWQKGDLSQNTCWQRRSKNGVICGGGDGTWRSRNTAGEWNSSSVRSLPFWWNVVRLVGLNVAVCVIVLLIQSVSRGRPFTRLTLIMPLCCPCCLCRALRVCGWTGSILASFSGLL